MSWTMAIAYDCLINCDDEAIIDNVHQRRDKHQERNGLAAKRAPQIRANGHSIHLRHDLVPSHRSSFIAMDLPAQPGRHHDRTFMTEWRAPRRRRLMQFALVLHPNIQRRDHLSDSGDERRLLARVIFFHVQDFYFQKSHTMVQRPSVPSSARHHHLIPPPLQG
jgi:hypothetical protein